MKEKVLRKLCAEFNWLGVVLHDAAKASLHVIKPEDVDIRVTKCSDSAMLLLALGASHLGSTPPTLYLVYRSYPYTIKRQQGAKFPNPINGVGAHTIVFSSLIMEGWRTRLCVQIMKVPPSDGTFDRLLKEVYNSPYRDNLFSTE